MRQQTLRALDEADVVVFVVDAREGVTAVDSEVAKLLHRSGKPVLVAANKVDNEGAGASASEAFALGFPDVFPVSASHGRGVSQFLDALVAAAARGGGDGGRRAPPRRPAATTTTARSGIAFVGKPNVGKSSLVNCLLGEERVLVHDQPGTTRDPIDTRVLVRRARVRAGRHRGHAPAPVDRHARSSTSSAAMARDQIERCDVAVLVVDAREARHRRGRAHGAARSRSPGAAR